MKWDVSLALIAGLISAATSALLIPTLRRWYQRRGWVDDPGGRKIHEQSTALAGGAAVLAGVLVGAGLAGVLPALSQAVSDGDLANTAAKVGPMLLIVTAGAGALLFLLGAWDDVAELSPRVKLLGQTLVACIVVGGGARLPIFQAWPPGQILASVIFFLATVNALNFLDNMNGLCAGLGCIAAIALGIIGVRLREPTLAIAAWALAGGCVGLLPFNYPKASVFLGDAGSHVIGGLLAVLAIAACAAVPIEAGSVVRLSPLWVLVVPGYDLLQVVIGRICRRQPIYVGDTHHVSHQLTRRGFSRAKAVLVLWIIAALAGLVGVWSLPLAR